MKYDTLLIWATVGLFVIAIILLVIFGSDRSMRCKKLCAETNGIFAGISFECVCTRGN